MTVIAKTAQELAACTPSGSATGAHPCSKVIPFYPLRYAVEPNQAGGFAYNHANLDRSFPALKGMRYVLRGLRDDDGYLYIYDPDNREQIICFVYRSPDGGTNGGQARPAQFQRLPLSREFKPIELAGKPLSFPYIPAYDHDPKKVVIWFADTLLTPAKLKDFQADKGGIRTQLGTPVNVTPWIATFKQSPQPEAAPAIKHTLRLEDVAGQHAVGLDGKPVSWSEYPQGAQLPTAADMVMAQGPGSARFAVALYDPVGMFSELSAFVATAFDAWGRYNAISQRALWTSQAADALLDQAFQSARNQLGTQGTAATLSNYGWNGSVYQDGQGNAARTRRASFLRDDLRQAFLKNDPKARANLQSQLNIATDRVWAWWTYKGAGNWSSAVVLYDFKDSHGYRALRGAVARSVLALALHDQGSQALGNMLSPQGPTGFLGDALNGHPEAAGYADAAHKTLPVVGDQTAEAAAAKLGLTLKSIPADGASQQLSQVVLGLLTKKGLVTPENFPLSRYARLLEVQDGRLLTRRPTALDLVPNVLRNDMGIKGNVPFRRLKTTRTPISAGIEDAIDLLQAKDLAAKAQANAEANAQIVRGLKHRLSLWHGVKLGAGALGIWVSAANLYEAVKKLGQVDGMTFANALDAGNNVLVTLSSGAAMRAAQAAVLEQRADLAGDQAAKKAAKAAEDSTTRWMIGFAGAAAFVGGLKNLKDQAGQQGAARELTLIDGAVQFSEAGLAATYLVGERFGITALASVTELGAGPIGLAIFALDILHTIIEANVQAVLAEQKVTAWLDHCLWGKDPNYGTFTKERLEYYRLSRTPQIETDAHLLKKAGLAAITGIGPLLVKQVPARTITVTLPGWKPQISAYRLAQHRNFNRDGVEQAMGDPDKQTFGDPGRVTVADGAGQLAFDTQTQIGDTVVTYWPNGFSDPDISFEVKN